MGASASSPTYRVTGPPPDAAATRDHARLLIKKRRSWGSISARIISRSAGEVSYRSNRYSLIYYLSDFKGTIRTTETTEQKCVLSRGAFAFYPPGVTAQWQSTAGYYIQILQHRDVYANIVSQLGGKAPPRLTPRYGLEDPLVSQIALAITKEIEVWPSDYLLAGALNIVLAVQMTRLCSDETNVIRTASQGLSDERLRRVYDYIEAHLNGPLRLPDLASLTGLSIYHFSRLFKQAVGIGPQRYVIQRRVERARRLIQRTNRPLALIAQDVGFIDQSHLTAVFRWEIGVTPGRYRAATF